MTGPVEVTNARLNQLRHGAAGLLAAGVALATAELVAGLLPAGRSSIVAVADAVIALTPGPVVRFAIETFGDHNRAVLLASMAAVSAAAGILIGVAGRRRRSAAVAGLTAFGIVGVIAGLTDPLVSTVSAVLAPTVGVAGGAAALLWLLRAASASEPPSPPAVQGDHEQRGSDPTSPLPPPRSRREFLVAAMAAAGATASFGVLGRALQGRTTSESARVAIDLPEPGSPVGPPPPGTQLPVDGISPLITPNDDFYRIDTAFTVPRIDPSSHRIRVTGMVDQPFELGYDELLDLVDTEAYVTLTCVSNEVGGRLIGNARWLGVPLAVLLDRAGVQPEATQIVGRSVDGWTGGFPVEAAFDGRTALVAVGMNGEPLPAEHGFPVRLVISGLYGYVSDTKWLEEIELTTFQAFDAYWIPLGWARHGPIKTQSRIDVPRMGATFGVGEVAVAGVAWSDERGVSAVEVAVDDGPWQAAELAGELASTSWRQWRFVWDADSGDHALRVRAFDADGIPQTAELSRPAPDGATGHHTIRVGIR